VYFRRLPDIRTTFPQDQQSHQSGVHHQGSIPDNPDQLVGVAAAELFEWAWLIGELACWLEDADEHTRADFDRFFGGYRTADKTAWFAAHIAERIAALLDGDRGQP